MTTTTSEGWWQDCVNAAFCWSEPAVTVAEGEGADGRGYSVDEAIETALTRGHAGVDP